MYVLKWKFSQGPTYFSQDRFCWLTDDKAEAQKFETQEQAEKAPIENLSFFFTIEKL